MANPVIVQCTKDLWVLVASNVTSGIISILSDSPSAYYQTYRDTGGIAPIGLAEIVTINDFLQISASAPIDVYIYCTGSNGSVRVDL